MKNTEKTYPTVGELRRSGRYKVKVHHERIVRSLEPFGELSIREDLMPLFEAKDMCKRNPWASMKARGGRTTLFLKDEEDGKEYVAVAKCCDKDNFCYKTSHQECLDHISKNENVEFEV